MFLNITALNCFSKAIFLHFEFQVLKKNFQSLWVG